MSKTKMRVDEIMRMVTETAEIKNKIYDRYPIHTYRVNLYLDDGRELYTIVRANRTANAEMMSEDNIFVDINTNEPVCKSELDKESIEETEVKIIKVNSNNSHASSVPF